MLSEEELTSSQIAERLDKTSCFVRQYLYRLRNYGLAENNEYFWNLSQKGVEIFNLLKSLKYFHSTSNRRVTERQQKSNSYLYKKPLQASLSAWSGKDSLSDCEKEVVEMLVKHYDATGSKFTLYQNEYELSERMGFTIETLQKAIKRLREDHIIYLIRERTQNCWKLALKKAFVELLESGER